MHNWKVPDPAKHDDTGLFLLFFTPTRQLAVMPTTFSDLPADIYIAIYGYISDFRTLVSLSRVDRAQAALVTQSISEERWRCLLAVEHIGRTNAAREAGVTWSSLAAQIVNHCAGCRLCKTVLDDIRFQYLRPHSDPKVLCKALSPKEAEKDKQIRMIEGVALNPHNRDRFQNGGTSAPLPLFSVWPPKVIGDRIVRLSLGAALVLDGKDGWAYKPENRSILDSHRRKPMIPELLDFRQDSYRLETHNVLSSLFITTVPLQEVGLGCRWFDRARPSSFPFRGNGVLPFKNPHGLTVHDILCELWKLEEQDSWDLSPLADCIGFILRLDNTCIDADFLVG